MKLCRALKELGRVVLTGNLFPKLGFEDTKRHDVGRMAMLMSRFDVNVNLSCVVCFVCFFRWRRLHNTEGPRGKESVRTAVGWAWR